MPLFSRFVTILFVLAIFGSSLAQEIDCDEPLEIWQIQGSGEQAHCLGERILTTNNIVTAIGVNGFFMQSPESQIDDDPNTSDGIYVFTDRYPRLFDLEVGDLVNVDGEVVEYYDFTELEALSPRRITVISSGHELPTPINLMDTDFGSSTTSVHPLEKYEGMLVSVEDAFVNAPTNYFSEFGVSLTGNRIFREMGIEADETPEFAGKGLPEFDLNPELVEVDPPEMGLPVELAFTGDRATVTGGLGYSYLDYQIWPSAIMVESTPVEPRPVRPPLANEFTIASQNVENLFDTIDDPDKQDEHGEDYVPNTEEDYETRLGKLSQQIRENLQSPDIVALQEVENDHTLDDLAEQIRQDDPEVDYETCLIEGQDGRGIDAAFLMRKGRAVIHDCYVMPGTDNVALTDDLLLFYRPPLVLDLEFINGDETIPLRIVNAHLKSLSGIDTDEVQITRLLQAEMVANYVQHHQNMHPELPLIVLGDLNAFEFSDGLVDVIGIIKGTHDPAEARFAPESDLVQPDLIDQTERLPDDEQYSYIWNSTAQLLDHILTTQNLDYAVTDIQASRGNADSHPYLYYEETGAVRSADHDGIVLYLNFDSVEE